RACNWQQQKDKPVRPKILIDRYRWTRQEDWDRLAQTADLVEPEGAAPYSEEALIAALHACQGLIKLGRRIPDLTRRSFEACPELKIVGIRTDRFGTGIDL